MCAACVLHVFVYIYMHLTSMFVCVYIYIYIHTYIHTYTCIHTYLLKYSNEGGLDEDEGGNLMCVLRVCSMCLYIYTCI